MNFYHCTNTNAARKILRPEPAKRVIKESYFDYQICLEYWLRRLSNNPLNPFPNTYYDYEVYDEEYYVYWLGRGVYCFSENNEEMASRYARSHDLDVIIDIDYDPNYTYFDLTKRIGEVIDLLKNETVNFFRQKGCDQDVIEAVSVMVESLLLSIEDEFFEDPHAAAIVIGLFLDLRNEEYDVVSNNFLKQDINNEYFYDEYHSIRNQNKILGLTHNDELSRLVRQ